MKICSKCKEIKSKFEFHKDNSTKCGLKTKCKYCVKAYCQENKKQIAVYSKTWRDVNKKQLSVKQKVWRETNKEQIAVNAKVYNATNKEKIATHNEENKEQIAVTKKAYREANKEQIAVWFKDYYKDNREKILVTKKAYREANKEKVNASNKVWRQANPERKLVYDHNRRALKLNAEGNHTHTDITNLIQVQNSKCTYCKTDLIITGKGKYHVDHIMPLFLGGTNYPENLQLLCPTCNCSKGPKHPDIYEKQINQTNTRKLKS
jgi:5-methylcytosine-specific restriction endonuclease McrA